MKVTGLVLALAAISTLSACSSPQKAAQESLRPQVVEFSDSEVPYIQAVKKDGKMTAVIVEPTQAAVK
ncbi:hypothetical protein D3C87_1537500 [compost metagenome]